MPPWVELKLLSAGGDSGARHTSIKDSLHRYDLRLLQALLADFLQLGTATGAGSYGLGATRQSLFMLALDGFLSRIERRINLQLIPDLLRLNAMPLESPPMYRVDPMEPKNLALLGTFFQSLTQAGLFVQATPQIQEALSAATGLPLEIVQGTPAPAATGAGGSSGSTD